MQKKISFKSNKGYLLKGVLHLPNGQGPWPAVIVQHGLTSDYNDSLVKAICSKLSREGLVALRFSLSGHKGSGGDYQDILISQFVKDVGQAIKFLLKQPQVRKKRIGIVGHSIGGFTALASANVYHQHFTSVVSISGFYDVDRLIKNYRRDKDVEIADDYFVIWGLKIAGNHFKDRFYVKRKYKISDIHCPVLVIHGDKDKTVQPTDARLIYGLLTGPKKLAMVKGGSHTFKNKKSFRRVAKLSVDWCKKYLAFKVSRVVNVFIEHQGRILLLKRSRQVGTHRGLWCSVGGFIDEGQTVLQQAREEVKEELGLKTLKLKSRKVAKPFKFEDKAADRVWQVYPVLFSFKDKPKIKLDWENSQFRWIKPAEVKKFKTIPMIEEDLKRVGL